MASQHATEQMPLPAAYSPGGPNTYANYRNVEMGPSRLENNDGDTNNSSTTTAQLALTALLLKQPKPEQSELQKPRPSQCSTLQPMEQSLNTSQKCSTNAHLTPGSPHANLDQDFPNPRGSEREGPAYESPKTSGVLTSTSLDAT